MIDVIFDMETSDPDDALTLCLLADHPAVNLLAVTITPGSKEQVAVVNKILSLFDKKIPVGAGNIEHPKQCVSEFHYKWLGNLNREWAPEAGKLIYEIVQDYPGLTVMTGGPLKNIKACLEKASFRLDEIVVQGGFAGDNVVAEEDRLEKFKGKITCPTFNLNGDVPGAKLVIATDRIGKKFFVSKNVCHGVCYDNDFHERLRADKNRKLSNKIIWDVMDKYHTRSKLLHDPLAAACLIDRNVCQFTEVELYREKGEWGSKAQTGTNLFISTKVDKEKFYSTMFL